jgi:hypothetical protein
MLRAGDLMAACADHLEREEGYLIPSRWPPSFGVIATHPEKGTLLLYALGEDLIPSLESKRSHTTRVMDEQEVEDGVAKIFYTAVSQQYGEGCDGQSVALILPDSDSFQKAFRRIKSGADKLSISVFLVRGGDKSVVRL